MAPFGHGAYLGPDFTADYLHIEALKMRQASGGNAEAGARTERELQANRYDPKTGVLTWTAGQADALKAIAENYQEQILNRRRSGAGLGPHAVANRDEIRKIVDFIAWTAWTASAHRPEAPCSYTNNWPPSRWWAIR